MKYNLEGKIFTSVANTENGEVSEETFFYYHQKEKLVWAEYSGGAIVQGHLIAKVLEDERLDMKYHHLNRENVLMVGECISTPSLLDDGRLLFDESWQWLTGDRSKGESQIIEVMK